MGDRLADAGPHLGIYRVHVDELREQDVNARVMAPEMFERLSENIRKEGRLEQLPFVVVRKDHFEVISGHHRLRAARTAGLTELYVLGDERDLSKSAVRAKQIAHNRISGTDDLHTLRQLFDDIQSVDDMLESYLSPDFFDDMAQLERAEISDLSVTLPYRFVGFAFLPKALNDLDALEKFVKRNPKADEIGLVSNEVLEEFRKVSIALSRKEDVRSMGAIVTRMLEIVRASLEAEGINLDDPETTESSDGAGGDRQMAKPRKAA